MIWNHEGVSGVSLGVASRSYDANLYFVKLFGCLAVIRDGVQGCSGPGHTLDGWVFSIAGLLWRVYRLVDSQYATY